jgi:hypothetical protein
MPNLNPFPSLFFRSAKAFFKWPMVMRSKGTIEPIIKAIQIRYMGKT